jgi:hypothetical protein
MELYCSLALVFQYELSRIGGTPTTCLLGISGIPLVYIGKSNLEMLETHLETVSGGQFDWGGRLLKSNASVQRYSWPGWKSGWTCNGKRVLDCDTYKWNRDESRP